MVKIGDLSYSWYLWHWPLIVFGAIVWPSSRLVLVFLGVASLIPAWLSATYIENPIRQRKVLASRGNDNVIRLYDVTDGTELRQFAMQPGNNQGRGQGAIILGGPSRSVRDSGPGLAFSPDGKWIAFFAYGDGGYDIWAVAPDGSNLARRRQRARFVRLG
jgi:WD40 repeat protein